jgi:RNA polymerase sigma-70 factor (ECF subfamily)
MEDNKIIDLYWDRDETAIRHTAEKYGRYCHKIAGNILYNKEDCEECVNDTYWKAWNAMPAERPEILSAFLGAITRNLSLDRYRKSHRKKRGEGEMELVYEEMEECIGRSDLDGQADVVALTECMNRFLADMEKENRVIFVRRYWYMDSISAIAEHLCVSESKVKSSLFRARMKLKSVLLQEGFEV